MYINASNCKRGYTCTSVLPIVKEDIHVQYISASNCKRGYTCTSVLPIVKEDIHVHQCFQL